MYTHFKSVKVSQLTGPRTRRLQDRESDTRYDTRRRSSDGALAGVSQTAVYDTALIGAGVRPTDHASRK